MEYLFTAATHPKVVEIYSIDTLCKAARSDWKALPKVVVNHYERGGFTFTYNGIYNGLKDFGSTQDYVVFGQEDYPIFVNDFGLKHAYQELKDTKMNTQKEAMLVDQTKACQQGAASQQLDSRNQQVKKETVNHPSHYNSNPAFETIKVLKAWLSPEAFEGFLVGNTLKYLSRYKHKNGKEDVLKSKWYLDELVKGYEEGYFKI